MQQTPGDGITRSLIRYLDANGYQNPNNPSQPYKIVLILDSGVVLRGTIISPDDFLRANSWRNDGHWPDPEVDGFVYPTEIDTPTDFVHLTDVEYLSGSGWVSGSTVRVGINVVQAAGEKY